MGTYVGSFERLEFTYSNEPTYGLSGGELTFYDAMLWWNSGAISHPRYLGESRANWDVCGLVETLGVQAFERHHIRPKRTRTREVIHSSLVSPPMGITESSSCKHIHSPVRVTQPDFFSSW